MVCSKKMQGFKVKESNILKKILSIDNFKGEDHNSSEAKWKTPTLNQASANSKRHFYHQTKKVFVGSWNVGGVAPTENLDLEDWLDTQENSAVLGFQEIVPLNAANVLLGRNSKISMKWNSLIGATLSNRMPIKLVQEDKIAEPEKVYPLKEQNCAEGEHGQDFQCIISRQMVGMFMTIWVRSDLYQHVRRVVWLGDLNYRIYMPDSAIQILVKGREWETLLKNDQLKMELAKGHVFEGWHEGAIEFPPTYKYHLNSEDYIGCDQQHTNKYRRIPAWCDRIIWFGKGMEQTQYNRGESTLSDHRPVQAMFTADIKVIGDCR